MDDVGANGAYGFEGRARAVLGRGREFFVLVPAAGAAVARVVGARAGTLDGRARVLDVSGRAPGRADGLTPSTRRLKSSETS